MIPLLSPQRQNESLISQIKEAVTSVLMSGQYILGNEVAEFEKTLAKELSFEACVGCSSGTEALVLILRALDLPPGSEVITPAFSFIASASAIALAGLKPVFADVSLDTGCLDTEHALKALSPRTRALIAVDLYGRQADIRNLKSFCKAHNLYLIEDGAQSIGVPNNGAHAFATSFYPTKNIGAMGDAGAVLTDDTQLAQRIRELSRHGSLARDHYRYIGTNARMDTIQAAILNIKLRQMKKWNSQRRVIAERYLKIFSKSGNSNILAPIPAEKENSHVWSLFTLRIQRGRSLLAEFISSRRVGTGIYYPRALTEQPALERFVTDKCPNAERLAAEVLSVPLYPELSESEIALIENTLEECLGKNLT
jgi:dTDP-4-amino-4,6-dideoxygalactose transaminase